MIDSNTDSTTPTYNRTSYSLLRYLGSRSAQIVWRFDHIAASGDHISLDDADPPAVGERHVAILFEIQSVGHALPAVDESGAAVLEIEQPAVEAHDAFGIARALHRRLCAAAGFGARGGDQCAVRSRIEAGDVVRFRTGSQSERAGAGEQPGEGTAGGFHFIFHSSRCARFGASFEV